MISSCVGTASAVAGAGPVFNILSGLAPFFEALRCDCRERAANINGTVAQRIELQLKRTAVGRLHESRIGDQRDDAPLRRRYRLQAGDPGSNPGCSINLSAGEPNRITMTPRETPTCARSGDDPAVQFCQPLAPPEGGDAPRKLAPENGGVKGGSAVR